MNTVILQDSENIARSSFISWDRLSGKTVFITGATGFVGSCIIRGIMYRNMHMNAGIKIAAMVRNRQRAERMFAEYLETGLIDFAVGDVCSEVRYDGNADFVIHCASNAAPKEYAEDPVGTMKTNFYGTLGLLEFAKSKNAEKFLYVSTIEVYGNTDKDGEITEDGYGYIDAVNPRSCYPISKKACETAAVCFGAQYGMPVSIGRLSYIFGAGMKKNDSKVVAILARAAAAGEDMVLKSKGEQKRSYTYISDAVTGLLTILLEGENGQAYNIASSLCITTIAGMGRTLEELYSDKGVKLKFDLPSEDEKKKFSPIRDAVLSNKKLRSLGWAEKTDLKDGLYRMTESIAEDNR